MLKVTVELAAALLTHIESRNPVLNAFLEVTAELALEQARAAEAEIMRLGPRGPLHGVPFGLKDIYDTRNIRTTGHSALLRDRVPARDSECTRRVYAAGAVLMGKLATHEFATGGPAYDLPWPPARNPWLLDRFPGGSSSGSGAAVAAGLLPGALGSDTAGSIRLPAAFCGLAGLKPTFGRVSKRGVLPLSWTFDTCGPLTWTVEDAALMLQAIAGHDALDPSTSSRPVPDFSKRLCDGIDGMRIGIVRHLYESDATASAATIGAMDDAMANVDALITATTYGPAPVQATMRAEANFANPPLTNPFNVAQLPALSICNGFSAEGLPLSMQIVGRAFDEATVLRIGHAYERATAWREQRPQLHPGATEVAPAASDATLAEMDPASVQRYRSRAQAAGLELEDQQLADLCQAMPHLEQMLAHIPADRDYDRSPGTVFSW